MNLLPTDTIRAVARLSVVLAAGCSGSSGADRVCTTCGVEDGSTHAGDTGREDVRTQVDAGFDAARPACAPTPNLLPEPTGSYEASATLQKIVISGAWSSYATGPSNTNATLGAQGVYSDGTTRFIDINDSPAPGFVWTSSDPSIAMVDQEGGIQGLRPGTVTITLTSGPVSGAVCFTVTPAVAQSLLVSVSRTVGAGQVDPSVAKPGDTLPFYCTETLTDGTTLDATTSVTWGSSSPSVAQISAGGSVVALAAGTTTITATLPASVPHGRDAELPGSLTLDVIGTGGGLAQGATCDANNACAPGLTCCAEGRLSSTSSCIPTITESMPCLQYP